MRKSIKYTIIFFISILSLDLFLSIFLEKEIYKMINNNLEIKPLEISRKQIEVEEIYNNFVPYWESEYRGPYFDFKENKKLQCRVLGIGDSVIWGSGVGGYDTYFKGLSNNIKNTEWINYGVPGHDALQSIARYQKSGLGFDSDLLIWHFRVDDYHIYKLVNGTLFNSKVTINDFGKPYLFGYEKLDSFLLKYSFLYNKGVKIKMKGEINNFDLDNIDYILYELYNVYNDFLSGGNNKKILIIFSPELLNNTYKGKIGWDNEGYPSFYKKIEKKFSGVHNINLLYLDSFFQGIDVKDIKYDDCCHFNEKGHKIIAEKLYDYIKTNKLLDEKCY